MRNYIGIACTPHDPALAIVDSKGRVRFAESTERYLQTKRALRSVPVDPVRVQRLVEEHCEAGADLVLATTWAGSRLGRQRLIMGLLDRALRRRGRRQRPEGLPRAFEPSPFPRADLGLARWMVAGQHASLAGATSDWKLGLHWQAVKASVSAVRRAIESGSPCPPAPEAIRPARRVFDARYDHHLTHASAAARTSPFEDALVAIVDGWGEGSSSACYRWSRGSLEVLPVRQRSPASLGSFYGMVCLACGFDPILGEEWKVMGMAPYGEYDDEIASILAPLLAVDGLRFTSTLGFKAQRQLLLKLAGFPAVDLAATAQQIFEDRMVQFLKNLASHGDSRNLILGGGCALNSSANGQVIARTPFQALHVPSSPGDDGNALGAALQAHRDDRPDTPYRPEVASPYLGSRIRPPAMEHLLRFGGLSGHSSHPGSIHERAAELLSQGKVIGWVQGRAEFGPRALGNRSILADPRRGDIKDRLNDTVKYREEFRPFAPSILHEHGPEWFESYEESPYMERTLRFVESARERVPGVVHVNGTGRLQTVKRAWNERYHDLLSAFHRLTGVPILLNTSFNVMGKPIVHSLEDALAVFHTSGLDALVVGDELFLKVRGADEPLD